MRYLFHRAFLRVLKNRRKYIPMCLQIIVGACLISISLSLTFNSFQQLTEFSRYLEIPFAAVTTDWGEDTSGITEDDGQYLRETYSEDHIVIYKQYLSAEPFYVIFANSDFFREIMGMKGTLPVDTAVAGKHALEILKNWEPTDQKLAEVYDKQNGIFFGYRVEEILSLETLDYRAQGLLSAAGYTMESWEVPSFEDVVILPLMDGKEFLCQTIVALPFKSSTGIELQSPLNDIETYLTSMHPNNSYVIRNYGGEIQETLEKNKLLSNTLATAAGFVLVIVFFGLLGLLLVLLNKRQREYAIALMCGANHAQLMIEGYVEIFFLVMASTLIGSFLSIPFLPFFSSMGVPAYYSIWTLVSCALGSIFSSIMVCLVSFYRIAHVSPVNVLKDL